MVVSASFKQELQYMDIGYDGQPKPKDLGFKTFFGNWTLAGLLLYYEAIKKHEHN